MIKLIFLISCDPSFEEIVDALLRVIDWAVFESSGFMRVDSDHVEPALRTLQHMTIEDELVLVAKNYIRQVLSLSQISLTPTFPKLTLFVTSIHNRSLLIAVQGTTKRAYFAVRGR
jgi:hypothetical protein